MVFLCCYGDDKMSMCLHLSTMFVKSNINMSLYVINDSQYLNITLMHLFSAKHVLLLVCTLNMGGGGGCETVFFLFSNFCLVQNTVFKESENSNLVM